MYHIVGKVGRGKVWRIDLFEHLVKESLANYRSANRLLIVSANLDGFSLVNYGRFAKFANLFPHQPFPLYGMYKRED